MKQGESKPSRQICTESVCLIFSRAVARLAGKHLGNVVVIHDEAVSHTVSNSRAFCGNVRQERRIDSISMHGPDKIFKTEFHSII